MRNTPRPAAALVVVAALFALPGCGLFGLRFQSPIVGKEEEIRVGPGKMTPSEIQSEVMSFTDTFNARITEQWNQVTAMGRAESPPGGLTAPGADAGRGTRLRRSAVENKLATVSAALSIASCPNPIVALSDMVTMITLQRMVLERPQAAALYGDEMAADLVEAYRGQEEAVWRIAARAMTPEQQQELRQLIAEWRREHPEAVYVANVRLEDFSSLRQQTVLTGGQSGGSLLSLVSLDPLANLDPTQRDLQKSRMLGERMFFYASRSPQLLKWHAESLFQSMVSSPEFKQALGAAGKVAEVADNLPAQTSATMNEFFTKLGEERRAAIADIDATLNGQREAMLRDIDRAQGSTQGTLKQLQETMDVTRRASETLTTTIQAADAFVARVNPPKDPTKPPEPERDALASYREAMMQTGDAADRLANLTRALDKLLTSPALASQGTTLQSAVLEVQASTKRVIDHAFWKMLILALATPMAVALSAGVYRRVSGRPKRATG